MTVYIFVDLDTSREAPYNAEKDTPDDLVNALGFGEAFDSIKDIIRNIVRRVSDGRDDEIIDDLHWLNFEVYDQEHPGALYDPTFAPR